MDIPRNEYPRPQFVRRDWLCLNGVWEFEIDAGDSGLERGLNERPLAQKILVPFCPESSLSGIGNVDFLNAVWYRRAVRIPERWSGRRVLLHFQAVDYDTIVWVNGREVGRHRGGWCGFTCDLHGIVAPGEEATIVVLARDDTRKPIPAGKQSRRYCNLGCHYTRTTGIWQTVWMEPVPEVALQRPRITPDLANSCIRLEQPITHNRAGWQVRATLSDGRGAVCTQAVRADSDRCPTIVLPIPADRRRLWEPGKPFLYDLHIELLDEAGRVVDAADSYAGLRSITRDGHAVLINGKPLFQRLVLDQGYYPDGVLTAPSDQALVRDIELAMEAGFNGARLHQKVFEERFLYHADRLGYLCWGEFGDWGIDRMNPAATYITQWLEVLHRDHSHPCLVGWAALNETWNIPITDRIDGLHDLTRGMVLAARAIDPTRLVLDASGGAHREPDSDVYDNHNYTQDPAKFRAQQDRLAEDDPYINGRDDQDHSHSKPSDKRWSLPYRPGTPFFCSEFGGIWWNPDARPDELSWGYGQRPTSVEEFYERFEGLCAALLENPRMFGYCYTQLTDVHQEQNGIYRFDRRPKFDMERIRAAQQKPAAIEQMAHR